MRDNKVGAQTLQIDRLVTERLTLVPFTIEICKGIIGGELSGLLKMGFKKGRGWPDDDVMETLPRIINNLSLVKGPTGFESWMIIKKDTLEIIGDLGFKGLNGEDGSADIGYGIIKEERRNGYAEEAARALIKWAFKHDQLKEITARCMVDNVGSVGLLLKLSFVEIKRDDEMVYWSMGRNTLG